MAYTCMSEQRVIMTTLGTKDDVSTIAMRQEATKGKLKAVVLGFFGLET